MSGNSNRSPCISSCLLAGTPFKSIPISVGAVHKFAFPVVPTKSINVNFSFPG